MMTNNFQTESKAAINSSSSPSAREIQDWLIDYLAKQLEVSREEIDITLPFDRYNMDSAVTIGMSGELENWLGCILDPTLVYDYPSIETLAQHLGSDPEVEVSWRKNLHR